MKLSTDSRTQARREAHELAASSGSVPHLHAVHSDYEFAALATKPTNTRRRHRARG